MYKFRQRFLVNTILLSGMLCCGLIIEAGAANVLFVVANPSSATDGSAIGDFAVYSRLNASHTVTVLSGNAVAADGSDADGQDLVVVSSTVSPASVAAKFTSKAVPLVNWQEALYDDLLMDLSGMGTVGIQSDLIIMDSTHPIADGISGTIAVTTSGQTFGYGTPPATAQKIARLVGNASQVAIFSFETGAVMEGAFVAPARRIGFFLGDNAAAYLNTTGWQLFDNAVNWALNVVPEPVAFDSTLRKRESAGPSSRTTHWAITEVMYNPTNRVDLADLEFIEVHNTRPIAQRLDGYRLSGEVSFRFPTNTVVPAGGYIVVAAEPASIESVYQISGVIGPWAGSLDNSGGRVRLRNAQDALLLELNYNVRLPWSAAPDGAGPSLVLSHPSYGEDSAKAWRPSTYAGGSPGIEDPMLYDGLNDLVINEILTHTDLPEIDYVEIFNRGIHTNDLLGCMLADNASSNRYVFPHATVLPPGGRLVVDQDELGFSLSAAGEQIYLFSPNATRVLDAFAFDAMPNGMAFGRYPDGSEHFTSLSVPSPATANPGLFLWDIVINEIMYNPISGEAMDEYIELYNRSDTPVNIEAWTLTGGISYTFPAGSSIPAGGYLVVAKDADHLIAEYGHLNAVNTVGDYAGKLGNRGDAIRLNKPDDPSLPLEHFVAVDEVVYEDGGAWTTWSDGDGSSLELTDPDSDNRLGANWADSDETDEGTWVTLSVTGICDNGNWEGNELVASLFDRGECLLDNVDVRINGGANNELPNGNFDTSLFPWIAQGTHSQTTTNGAGELHVVATSGGDNGVNRFESDMFNTAVEDDLVSISADVKWLKGARHILLRLRGSCLELSGEMPLPTTLGTPGLVNSTAVANQAPGMLSMIHQPVLPKSAQDVLVTTRVQDPDGVNAVVLNYRVEPSSTVVATNMNDSGTGGDELANDGLYSAVVPGQSGGTFVGFHVTVEDRLSSLRTYPIDYPAREALIRWGSLMHTNHFAAYRFWMTAADLTEWETRQKLSNTLIPGTLIYGDQRVIYGVGARYRGSPFIRPQYDSPVTQANKNPNMVWRMPKDDLLLGVAAFNLDGLEQPGRDDTLQRERMAFWMAQQRGMPHPHQRYCRMFMNGVLQGEVYSDTFQPARDFISTWFPNDDEGELLEVDNWFEFDDGGQVASVGNIDAALQDWTTTDGAKKKARYRYNWGKKSVNNNGDRYNNFYPLVDAINHTNAATYAAGVHAVSDVRSWANNFAFRRACGDWDGYGFTQGKNTFIYRPVGGQWFMLPWDMDFSLGANSRATDHGLFLEINDPVLKDQWFGEPEFIRAYWQSLYAFATGPMEAADFDPESDAWSSVFQAYGVRAAGPSSMQAWVSARRAFILQEFSLTNTASFAITSNGGVAFATGASPVRIQGTAPLQVDRIYLNGSPITVSWIDVNTWAVDVPLVTGTNDLNFVGYALSGLPVGSASDRITVTFTGDIAPLAGNLIISEVMYKPLAEAYAKSDDLEFIELKNIGTETLNLQGVYFDAGLTYAFTNSEVLAAGEFIILVSSNGGFAQRYPGISIDGEYVGQLKNSGEYVSIVDSIGQPITSVDYLDVAPWPTLPDTAGYSLVPAILRPSIPQTNALEWTSSCKVGGSPREDDAGNSPTGPRIVTQPINLSVAPSGTAFFECLAVSCPPPQYQWSTNGTFVVDNTNTSFVLHGVTSNLNGLILQCRVTNSLGGVTSDYAVLLVESPSAGSAPVMDSLTNVIIDADTLVSFTASATDTDGGQSVFYTLGVGAPLGASIQPSSGVFSWTPSNADEGVHLFTVIAYDNGSPSKSDAEIVSIRVNKINHAPMVTVSNQVVSEEIRLTFIVEASDIDLPPQNLSFSLENVVPSGAVIHATNGTFNWTPTEAQGPGVYELTLYVTDDGVPSLTSTNVFQIEVEEVNRSPVISPIGVVRLHPSGVVLLKPVVVDPDIPEENLWFSLSGNPSNVTVNPTSGVLRFDVDTEDVGALNTITFTAQDSGLPIDQSFLYSVLPEIVQSVSYTTNGQCQVEWNAFDTANYHVEYCDDLVNTNWFLQEALVASGVGASVIVDVSTTPYRIFRVRWLP